MEGRLHLQGRVISLDGQQVIDCYAQGDDPQELGLECARRALAQGAGELLAITAARE
jgi:porphobilinogen deaminase